MRSALLAGVLLLAGTTSCVIGAPPGFSDGNSWTIPLVDPLSDGRLVVPMKFDGKGPFLFVIDPDAHFTTADRALAGIVGVPAHGGARLRDEHDTSHPTFYAQIPNVKVGTLGISLLRVGLVENNSFNADGRRIWGVIGRDIIADSLVYTIDRDRGAVTLTVNDKYAPPAGAQIIPYQKLVPRVDNSQSETGMLPTTRYMVTANIDGKQALVHMDLGDAESQLDPRHWDAAKLHPTEWTMDLIDEAGTHRTTTQDGIAESVGVPTEDGAGTVARQGVGFVPFTDKRWVFGQIDGTLGLDFFRPYVVSADWQHEHFILSPRQASAASTAERLGRWGTGLTSQCKIAGCASATAIGAAPPPTAEMGMATGDAAPSPAPGNSPAILNIERDPTMNGHELQLVFSATTPDGRALPMVEADLDALTSTFSAPIEPRYADAKFEVVDLSPFPRACANHAPSCMHLAAAVAP
jgi:hypothetical protein